MSDPTRVDPPGGGLPPVPPRGDAPTRLDPAADAPTRLDVDAAGTRVDGGTRIDAATGRGGTHVEPAAALAWRRDLPPALAARYVVERALPATGGQGDVLVARELASGALVAVKLYRRAPTAGYREVLDRVAALRQPGVVEFLEVGTDGGVDYEVMPYYDLGSLADLVPGAAPLGADALVHLARVVSDALAALHAAGIVHRDLKPSNLLVAGLDPLDVRLADFGVAATGAESRSDRTRVGNPRYEAPEVYTGVYGPGVDWWGLGLVLLECITGRSPFVAADGGELPAGEILSWVRWRPLPLPDGLEPRLRRLLRGLLTKSPEQRWGAEQVREWLTGGEPADFFDEVPAFADPIRHPDRPFLFGDSAYTDRGALATALLRERRAGERLVLGVGLDELVAWAELFDPSLARHLEAIAANVANGAWRSPLRALVEVAAAIDRTVEPRLDGERVDAGRLGTWARAAVGGDATAAAVVGDLERSRALLGFAVFTGSSGLAEVDTAWHALRTEVEAIRTTLPEELGDLVGREGVRLSALALLAALDRDYAHALVEHARGDVARHPAVREAWFAALVRGLAEPDHVTATATALVLGAVRDEAEELEFQERMRLLDEAAERLRADPGLERQPRYRPVRRSGDARRGRIADRLDLALRFGVLSGAAGMLAAAARLPFDVARTAAGLPDGHGLPARWVRTLEAPEPVEVGARTWVALQEAWASSPVGGLDPLVVEPLVPALVGALLAGGSLAGFLALRRYRYYRDARSRTWLGAVLVPVTATAVVVALTLPWQLALLPAAALLLLRRR